MSKQFEVSANGSTFGVYEADSEQGARDACAVDAGYKSEADMVERLGQPSELVAVERLGSFEIVGQYRHLADTDAGRAAVEEYEAAIESGKDHVEAEIMASNVLQRAGFNVNRSGGITIERSA